MTRTASDAALALTVLSGPDRRDFTSLPPIAELDDVPLSALRIGLLLDAGTGLPVDPEVAAAVSNAASLLESAGATVEPIAPIITRSMLEGLDHFWRARSAADIAALPPERQEKVLPDIRRWVSTAADLTGIDVVNGFNQTIALATAVDAAFASYDFIVSPVAPITAFAAELGYPTDDPMKPFEHIAFTVPYNMSAHPAASVNCGYSSDGLPIGLQIAGPRFHDLPVLRLAALIESRTAHHPWPVG